MNDILLPFALIILAGVACRRFRVGNMDADTLRQGINVMVLNIFLPALCIKTLYAASIDIETILIPATAIVTTLSTLAIAVMAYTLLGRIMHLTQQEKGVLVISAAFGNVTYLGLPVLTGLYGPSAAKYALFYDLLATTPVLWLAGASLASHYGENRKMNIRESIRAIISLPPIWGIACGIMLKLSGIPLPSFLLRSLEMLGSLVVPLMIFSIGLALTLPRVSHAYAIIPAVIIKMAVSPFISFATAQSLGLQGQALSSTLLEGAMPTMVLSLLIASRFKLDISLSAFIIVVTTVLSFITLPVAVHIGELLVK
ncbi:MAG: AEC family transporter [Nitrospirae bacterium]|nr:AEC family transporter [Nitrospirota bacterium]